MGGNIVLNLIKTTFAGIIVIVLCIVLVQKDGIESRLRSVQDGQAEQQSDAKAVGRQIDRLQKSVGRMDKRLQALDKAIRSGGIAVRPGGNGSGGTTPPPDPDVDPRTLPYWPSEDNILVGLENEPRPPEDAPEGGTINFWVGSNFRSLNPYVDSDVDQRDRVATYVYETLATQSMADPTKRIPGLANRVTVSEDKKIFTIFLRKGVYWHDPTLSDEERRGKWKWLADLPRQEVTAHDAKFTFDLVRNPLSECSSELSYFTELDTVEVVDRYTLRVTWKTKSYYNLGSTIELLTILPRHVFGRDSSGRELDNEEAAQLLQKHPFNRNMCGTGPMRFKEFNSNVLIRLERNDDYWGIKPKIDELVLKIIIEPEMRLSLFKRGEIDLYNLQPSQWRSEYLEGNSSGSVREMEASGKVVLKRLVAFGYRYIGWNQKRAIFRDRTLRRALAHAFDKERVVRDVLYGLAQPHNAPVHPDLPYYNNDLVAFPFDLKKAAALLDEAGWMLNANGVREKVVQGEKKELRFKILMPNSLPLYRDFGLIYKKDLAKIGVVLDLDLREWQKMLTDLQNKDFDACALGWGLSYDSDESQIWSPEEADKPRSSNHVAYKSEPLGEVLEKLKLEFDPAGRIALYKEFQRIIVEDQPYLFLTVNRDAWFYSSRLGGPFFNKLRPQIYLLPWFVKEPE